jgi:hypothetical protein
VDPNDIRQKLKRSIRTNKEYEVEEYLRAAPGLEGESPFEHWRRLGPQYPRMRKLFRAVYAVQATSTSVERLFSGAGKVAVSGRASLSPDSIVQLVSARDWKRSGLLKPLRYDK